MKSIKHLKLIAAAPALLILFFSATVAYGGLRWGGIDPTVTVNGRQVDVRVEWPEQHTCAIDDEIEIDISYPEGADARLVSESSGRFQCDDGVRVISTETELNETSARRLKHDKIGVTAFVEASVKMPVKVIVSVDDKKARTCRGSSNKLIKCGPFKLPKGR